MEVTGDAYSEEFEKTRDRLHEDSVGNVSQERKKAKKKQTLVSKLTENRNKSALG
jgi:hypothetical protein